VPGVAALLGGAELLLSWLAMSLLFGATFKALPDVVLRWRDVVVGALVTALLFSIGRYGIAAYLAYTATASAYGAAGSMMVLLLWVYYSCQILLFGAEFTRVYAQWRGVKPKPEPFAQTMINAVGPEWFLTSRGGSPQQRPKIVMDEFIRCFTPKTVSGACRDYRAGATLNFEMDAADKANAKVAAARVASAKNKQGALTTLTLIIRFWLPVAASSSQSVSSDSKSVPARADDQAAALAGFITLVQGSKGWLIFDSASQ